MFIKRSAFLLLTGVLAQQACTTDKTDDPGTAGTGGDGGSSAEAGAGGSDNQAGSSMSVAGSGEAGAPGGAGSVGGAGLGGAGLGGAALGGDSSGGVGGATGGAGGDGGMTSCDDSLGTPGDCALTCTDESAKGWCNSVLANLKPAVGETYYSCIDEGTLCDDFTYDCVKEALAGACPVPENDALCTELADLCTDANAITVDECHALIDGLSETGMEGFNSCIEVNGCSIGVWSCVEGLP